MLRACFCLCTCDGWKRLFLLLLNSYLILYNFIMIALDMIIFFWIRAIRIVAAVWDRLVCLVSRGRRLHLRRLKHEMYTAATYSEWWHVATELDKVEKNDEWRSQYESTSYDFEVIRAQITHLRELKKDGGRLNELLSILRGMLSRSYAGLNSKELFGSSHLGTKHLVEEFQTEVVKTLAYLSSDKNITEKEWPSHERAQFFHYARHSYGRTALCLSGGGALTMYHMGVIRSLIENNILPKVISGTSGGSIVAGMLARYRDDEMIDFVLKENISTKYGVRWFETFPTQLHHFLAHGTLTNKDQFARTCRAYYGDVTFGDAYRHTRRGQIFFFFFVACFHAWHVLLTLPMF